MPGFFASLLIQNVHFLNCKITPHSINWMLELIKFTPHFIHPQVWNMIWQHSIIDYWSHWVTVYEHSSYQAHNSTHTDLLCKFTGGLELLKWFSISSLAEHKWKVIEFRIVVEIPIGVSYEHIDSIFLK